jgi:hypothetical protein
MWYKKELKMLTFTSEASFKLNKPNFVSWSVLNKLDLT